MELGASDSTAGVLVTRPLRVGQVPRLLHLAMAQVTALLDPPLAIILITAILPVSPPPVQTYFAPCTQSHSPAAFIEHRSSCFSLPFL